LSAEIKTGIKVKYFIIFETYSARRLRWTPLHSCVIGWAESRAMAQMGEVKGNVNWNQKNKVTRGLGVKRDVPRVSTAACEVLGLSSRSSSCGVDSAGKSERRRHGEILNLLLKVKLKSLMFLIINYQSYSYE
jgi:hypothetical protein